MTKKKDFKARIRERMSKTGESFSTARMQMLSESVPQPAHLSEAAKLLNAAFTMEPRLRPNGIAYKAGDVNAPALAKAREEMSRHLDEVAGATAWLRNQRRSDTYNELSTSYGFKHQAEEWSKKHGGAPYISNGALIAAALGLGFKLRHVRGTLNIELALDERTRRGLPSRKLTPFYLWLMRFIREESPRGDVARDAQYDFETLAKEGAPLRGFWDGRPSQLLRRTRGTAAMTATLELLAAFRSERRTGKHQLKPSFDRTWRQVSDEIGSYLADLAKEATRRRPRSR